MTRATASTREASGTKHTFKIAAIPADGVGKEVIAAGRRVLDTAAAQTGTMSIDFDYQGVPHTLDPWRASQDRTTPWCIAESASRV